MWVLGTPIVCAGSLFCFPWGFEIKSQTEKTSLVINDGLVFLRSFAPYYPAFDGYSEMKP